MCRHSAPLVLLACLAMLAPSSEGLAAGTCNDPGDETICSALCTAVDECTSCCQKRFDKKYPRTGGLLAALIRIFHYQELSACKGHCITDLEGNSIGNLGPVMSSVYGGSGQFLGTFTFHSSNNASGLPGHRFIVSMVGLGNFEMWVGEPAVGVPTRVELRDFSSHFLILVVSEAPDRLTVQTGSGTEVIVSDGDDVTPAGVLLFESLVEPNGSAFEQQLLRLAEIGDAAPQFEPIGTILRQLYGIL